MFYVTPTNFGADSITNGGRYRDTKEDIKIS